MYLYITYLLTHSLLEYVGDIFHFCFVLGVVVVKNKVCHFPVHIDAISMECPFCISSCHWSNFSNYDVYIALRINSILANSADPDGILCYAAFNLCVCESTIYMNPYKQD